MIEASTALTYLGRRFHTAESDYEVWLRADELGHALAVDPPEQAVLDIHQENLLQFSERLSILTPVEAAGGPRLMRAFNLLGAYVLSTFVLNPEAQRFRRWLLETLIYFQIDIRREIEKLKEEDRRLREYFEAAIQALAEEVRALREAQTGREDRSWFEGEFHRWREAQTQTAEAVKTLSTRIGHTMERRPAPSIEDVSAVLRAYLDPLVDGMAGLYERFETMAAAGDRIGAPAALGDSVPVLTLPSHYSLTFHSEAGDRLTVMFWNDTGPWFFVRELADLLAPPEEDLRDLDGFIAARVPTTHRDTAQDRYGSEAHLIVSETGLVLLFRSWSEFMLDRDKQKLGRWIADQVIPSALSLRLKETKLDPEHRPADFPVAPTEVLADRLFKVYAGELDGRPLALVNARDLHKFLGFRKAFVDWYEDRRRWAGFRNGVHYVRVFVTVRQYDYYLTLDAAGSLLCQESHPRAVEAREYLREVVRERGTVIEGEATVVKEGELVSVPFHERTLLSFKRDGKVYVAMKPLVESMGMDWKSQYARIQRDEVLSTCMVMMTMQMPGDDQRREIVGLPLKLLNGWLFGIDAKRVKKEIREDILLYKRESYDILYRHWHGIEQVRRPSATTLPDTPPHQPLAIPYKEGTREIPVRVAVRQGRPWFLAFDVALIVDGAHDDPRPAFAGLPEGYRDLCPSPDGESAVLWVNEAGLAYYLGGRPHKPAAERLRVWLLEAVRPALQERMGTVPAAVGAAESNTSAEGAAPQGQSPEENTGSRRVVRRRSSKVYYTHRDPLYLACVALAERSFRAGETRRTGGSAVSANYGRLLAWLWRNSPAEGWLELGSASRLAAQSGIPRRSLRRVIERVVAWEFAEQRPERPDGWPEAIRLDRDKVRTALRDAGLEVPE